MFNWSMALRAQTEYISPKGPSFQSARWTTIDVNGTKIKFKAPRHKTNTPAEAIHPERSYDLNRLQADLFGEGEYRWYSTTFVHRHWAFNGPWLTGNCGTIRMSGWIISPYKVTEGLNFFHPRALENGVANYLTFKYGSRMSSVTNEQMWLAPVNWRPQVEFPCVAARFNAVARIVLNDGPDMLLMLPLSKHHLLLMRCGISRDMVPPELNPRPTIDEWIDLNPFLELVNQVLGSLEITLSPEAQAQQEAALRGLQDKSLISEFPPLQWAKTDLALG